MATLPQFVPVDTLQDLEYPQREAAFFYGLFLRGHSADQLRRDIEVPSAVLAKWHREAERDPQLKDVFERMVDYRDRKSTRLNSSHGYISYAVFCLKKKKTTHVAYTNQCSCTPASLNTRYDRIRNPIRSTSDHPHSTPDPVCITHFS